MIARGKFLLHNHKNKWVIPRENFQSFCYTGTKTNQLFHMKTSSLSVTQAQKQISYSTWKHPVNSVAYIRQTQHIKTTKLYILKSQVFSQAFSKLIYKSFGGKRGKKTATSISQNIISGPKTNKIKSKHLSHCGQAKQGKLYSNCIQSLWAGTARKAIFRLHPVTVGWHSKESYILTASSHCGQAKQGKLYSDCIQSLWAGTARKAIFRLHPVDVGWHGKESYIPTASSRRGLARQGKLHSDCIQSPWAGTARKATFQLHPVTVGWHSKESYILTASSLNSRNLWQLLQRDLSFCIIHSSQQLIFNFSKAFETLRLSSL